MSTTSIRTTFDYCPQWCLSHRGDEHDVVTDSGDGVVAHVSCAYGDGYGHGEVYLRRADVVRDGRIFVGAPMVVVVGDAPGAVPTELSLDIAGELAEAMIGLVESCSGVDQRR